jgi:hypothetical protein
MFSILIAKTLEEKPKSFSSAVKINERARGMEEIEKNFEL